MGARIIGTHTRPLTTLYGDLVDRLREAMFQGYVEYTTYAPYWDKTDHQIGQDDAAARRRAHDSFQSELPKLRSMLEVEMRAILHVAGQA